MDAYAASNPTDLDTQRIHAPNPVGFICDATAEGFVHNAGCQPQNGNFRGFRFTLQTSTTNRTRKAVIYDHGSNVVSMVPHTRL